MRRNVTQKLIKLIEDFNLVQFIYMNKFSSFIENIDHCTKVILVCFKGFLVANNSFIQIHVQNFVFQK